MKRINLFIEDEMYEKLKGSGNVSKAVRDALCKFLEIPKSLKEPVSGRPKVEISIKVRRLYKMLDYVIKNMREDGLSSFLSWEDVLLETFDRFRVAELTARKLTFVFQKIGIVSYLEAVDNRNISDEEMLKRADRGDDIKPTHIEFFFNNKVDKEQLEKSRYEIEKMEFL